MNILIITHHFPPENAMASLRPYSWAKYWSRMGHEVFVLTTKKESFDAPLTLNLEPSEFGQFKIEEVSYLRQTQKIRTEKKTDGVPSSPKKRIIDPIVQWSRKIRQSAGMGALVSIRSLWIQPALRRAIELNIGQQFDVVVSTYGPPASHIIAGLLKRRSPRIIWVADYRDLWNDYYSETRKWPFSAIENFIENNFVGRADLVTTVSDPLKEILSKRFPGKVFTVENGFDLDDLSTEEDSQALQQDLFQKKNKVTLVYTGRIHSQKRDPSPLFKAIKKLYGEGNINEQNFEVLFFSNEVGFLPDLINQFEIDKLIKIPGFVSRDVSLSIQRNADALIFLDWSDRNIDGILTGKLFEYLYSGKPILGIGSFGWSAPGRLIKESGCGLCLGTDVEKISEVLMRLVNGEPPFPYSPNQKILERYTRHALAQKMLNLIMDSKAKS